MGLVIVGLALIALGLFSGIALVVAPLGLAAVGTGMTLWVAFPLFSVIGFLLFAVGARTNNIRALSSVVSALLLVLAVGSAIALVLDAAAIIHPTGSTLGLWYVLVIAGVLGAFGSASVSKTGTPA